MSHIEAHDIKQRRPRKQSTDEQKKRFSSFQYFVLVGTERTLVCQKAFLSLHAVGMKRVFNITRALLRGEMPHDKRGKNHKVNKFSDDILKTIDDHIKSFPLKSSHYAGKEVQYLDARLCVKSMYELYCEKYPDTSVKYDFYRQYFRENFDFKFGRPQIDVCSLCEELGAKIKSPHICESAKLAAKADLEVHLRRSRKFYNSLKEIKSHCLKNEDSGAIAFDFMQNLPLPEIPVQEIFYMRQLWVNVFNIHDLKTDKSVVYLYHEGNGKKGANEVCSFLSHYIEHYVPDTVKNLTLFSDGCPGQNKNHTMVRMCMGLTATGRFQSITHNFPERGHSFLPCDRNFGVFKKKIKNVDRVYTPKEYVEIIANSRKNVEVHAVKFDEIINFDKWWPSFFKKTVVSRETANLPRNKKQVFSPSKFKQFRYSNNRIGEVEAFIYINSVIKHTFFLGKQALFTNPTMPSEKAYNEKVPINFKKLQDVRKVVKYVPYDALNFYNDILKWPATQTEGEVQLT